MREHRPALRTFLGVGELVLLSNRIAEYFDLWCEGTTCYTAWIGTPNNDGDVLVTTIQ
jgi:hypothetical protein